MAGGSFFECPVCNQSVHVGSNGLFDEHDNKSGKPCPGAGLRARGGPSSFQSPGFPRSNFHSGQYTGPQPRHRGRIGSKARRFRNW